MKKEILQIFLFYEGNRSKDTFENYNQNKLTFFFFLAPSKLKNPAASQRYVLYCKKTPILMSSVEHK